jgi:hypothetical protein
MRTLGFRTNVMLALATAIGLVAALGRPWDGPSPPHPHGAGIDDLDGPLNALFAGIQRAFSARTGDTGWHVLGTAAPALAVAAGVVALLALLCVPAATQPAARALVHWAAFVPPALVVWRLLDRPGSGTEPRYGALIALGCALLQFGAAHTVAGAPLRRRVVKAPFQPPAPPPAFGASAPPPSR